MKISPYTVGFFVQNDYSMLCTELIASNTPNYRVRTRVHVRVSDNYGEFILMNWFSAQFSSRDRLPIISGRRNEVIGPVLVLNTTHFCLRRRQIVDVEMRVRYFLMRSRQTVKFFVLVQLPARASHDLFFDG